MLDRLKNILPSSRRRRADTSDTVEKISAKKRTGGENGGPIYKSWLLVLPLFVGLASGKLASVGLGYGLDYLSSNAGVVDASVSGASANAKDSDSKNRGMAEFVSTNPFHISPMKTESNTPAPAPVVETPPPEPPKTLDEIILRGTFPGISAWFDDKGKLSLITVGSELEGFKLASVSYREAVFTRGDDRITKYLTYGPVALPKPDAPKPAPKAAPAPAPQPRMGNVIAAEPNKNQEGQISSELVGQLVQNPFDELKRIRIRPNETAGGLEVQWIQNESILKQLGVQKGDIIRSVNGIPFTNMGDIANSINSLMNSERFDVEVTRGGKATALRYVVK